jgi:tubulin-specific chaperone A
MTTTTRQLTIQSGAAKRLFKEHKHYEDEAVQQKIKVDSLVAQYGEDEWEVKNGRRMLEESNKMITDSSERLGKAAEDLRNLITAAMKEPDVADSTQLAQAKEVLEAISG